MHYEINVSLNGKHFFATDPRSLTTREKAKQVYDQFMVRFPEKDGFNVTVTKWENRGQDITDAINNNYFKRAKR